MCDDPFIVGQFWYRFTNALQRWLCVSNECWKHGNAFSSKRQIKAVAGGADFAMGIVADCFAGPMCRGGLGSHFDPDFGIGIGRVGRKFDPCGFAACKGCIGGGSFRMPMTTLRCEISNNASAKRNRTSAGSTDRSSIRASRAIGVHVPADTFTRGGRFVGVALQAVECQI